MIRENEYDINIIEDNIFLNKILTIGKMWATQLDETSIINSVINGKESNKTLVGVLFENYHYLKLFPEIIKIASKSIKLKEVYLKYFEEEKGHEVYILNSLELLNYKRSEILSSIPLVSTTNIINLMKGLVQKHPSILLYIAKIIENDNKITKDNIVLVNKDIEKFYGKEFSRALDGLLMHAKVDYELGHYFLLDNNLDLFDLNDIKSDINFILNAIHDIKHAFDLQNLEISSYYNDKGNYIPRQYVDYFGV